MENSDHSFDWRGFNFALGLVAMVVVLFGASGYEYSTMTAPPKARDPIVVASPLIHVEHAPRLSEAEIASFSTSTPQRIINQLTIDQVVPQTGKFIAADLVNMKLTLYQDGTTTAQYDILEKGRPGTPWETPSGFYSIQSKEDEHFSSIGKVYMPYSMQFYGNYFIHGWPYYPDGTAVSSAFTGGCIRLSTADAQKVFEFADVHTKVFVYDSKRLAPLPSLSFDSSVPPPIVASSYLVADIDTGEVYAEKEAQVPQPISSLTKLMTALVANETISLDKHVSVSEGALFNPENATNTKQKSFLVDDLFYPLLMQSSNTIAENLASYYGPKTFVHWMNTTANALDMASSTFTDPQGSENNISTPDDLFRLTSYLLNKKSFVFNITRQESKVIESEDGSSYTIQNMNAPVYADPFYGGAIASSTPDGGALISLVNFKIGDIPRRIAIIVLGSSDETGDAQNLASWVTETARVDSSQTACADCAHASRYRTIPL